MTGNRQDSRMRAPGVSRRMLGRLAAGVALGAPMRVHAGPTAPALLDPAPARPIRIGSNENPYGPGPAAIAAIRLALADAHRYPGQVIARLSSELASRLDVPADALLLAAGSGEILRASVLAFTSGSRALVTAAPTFEAPARAATASGAPVRAVPVDARGQLDLAAMALQASGAGLFFICNPNNPTGGVRSAADVADFVARVRRVSTDAVVLVDEAYFDYVEDPSYATAIPLTRRDPRVVVSRTFSKLHGMAGLRVGYLVGQPDAVSAVRAQLSAGTLAGPSAAAALASLADAGHLVRQRALNKEARAFTRGAFEAAGLEVLPSEANFLMVNVKREAGSFLAACRSRGVLLARPFPPLATFARISIGTMAEMQQAVEVMLPIAAQPAPAGVPTEARVGDWGSGC